MWQFRPDLSIGRGLATEARDFVLECRPRYIFTQMDSDCYSVNDVRRRALYVIHYQYHSTNNNNNQLTRDQEVSDYQLFWGT